MISSLQTPAFRVLCCLTLSFAAQFVHGAPVIATQSAVSSFSPSGRASAQHPGATSVNELLAAGSKAVAQHRLLSPAGDNAFAYYEAALKEDPANRIARNALLEIFPFGAQAVERTIKARDGVEAQRQLDLLAKADPDNYTLKILRAKLAPLVGSQADSQSQSLHELTLVAAADSWVAVSRPDREIFSGVLHAGEQRSFSSAAPLEVTVGNAAGVKALADGTPVAITPQHGGKVSRFRVFSGPRLAGVNPRPVAGRVDSTSSPSKPMDD